MGLNINLFVHGVPMGQKIWGPKSDAQRYLLSFYGSKWETPEVMKVEILTLGGVTNCYYSFVKGLNVCDSQGRKGSYIALTLRINAFYVDVQNIYNILKAVYEKMCVGLCVQETGATVKYLVADFQSIDSKLKDIEKQIFNYIGDFSVNEDIVSLARLSVNSQGAIQSINLHECTKHVALDSIKKTGKIMVSPYFLSACAAETVGKYKAEMEKVKQEAQQKIQQQQRISQEKITAITQQSEENLKLSKEHSQQQIAQINAENERKMQDLKQHYVGVGKKMEDIKQSNKRLEKEVSDWKKQYNQKDKELQSSNTQIQKLQETVDRLQFEVSSQKEGKGIVPVSYPPKPFVVGKKFILIGIAAFFVILLIGLLINLLMGKNRKRKIEALQAEVVLLERKNEQMHEQNERLCKKLDSYNEDKKSNICFISVKENGKEVEEVECGHTYVVSLTGEDVDTLKGEFNGPAFYVQDSDHLMAKRDSAGKTCIIRYVYKGKTIATKSIKIKKDEV